MTLSAGAFELVYDPSIGESEPWYVNDHTFVRDSTDTWHLIGITHAEPFAPFDEVHLAHATAPALHGPWTKQPFALSADASAGETHLWAPHVITDDDGLYWMFYCAGGSTKHEYRIHAATSHDCRSWTRHGANPLVVDGYEARDPMILRVDDRWIMYYTATSEPTGGHFIVAAAESDDLVHWHGRHEVYRDRSTGTMAGPTESPFVVEHDGRFHLLIGPDFEDLLAEGVSGRWDEPSYRRTRVLVSDDPLAFDARNQVAVIDAHAAEVILDESGRWWVSHCGWGQGGVHLAPLSW